MGEAKRVLVEATIGFSSAHAGSRELGEQFEYDMAGDPARLKAEGKVVAVKDAGAKAPEPK